MRMDGRAICRRCKGSAHDLVRHSKGEMTLQCCYCLEFAYVFGYPPEEFDKPKPVASGKYVLKYGRHAGQSLESVASSGERGIEYLRLLAKDTPKLKDIINDYLDSRSAVSVTAAPEPTNPQPHRPPSRDEASISGSQ
jgi:hypothetical protein